MNRIRVAATSLRRVVQSAQVIFALQCIYIFDNLQFDAAGPRFVGAAFYFEASIFARVFDAEV
jgi:hypothetical protein